MRIVLIKKWMNHNRGENLDIVEGVAQRLVDWKTARLYDDKRDGKKNTPTKAIKGAPANKMMAGAPAMK